MTYRKKLISSALIATMLLIVFLGFVPEPAMATTGTFGYTSTGTTGYTASTQKLTQTGHSTGFLGYVWYRVVTAGQNCTVSSVGVNISTKAGNIRTAIYSNSVSNLPQTLQAESGSTAAVNGWNDLSLGSSIYMVSGKKYWVAFQESSNTNDVFLDAADPVRAYETYGYAAFPATATPTQNTGSGPTMQITFTQIKGYGKATKATLTISGGINSMSFYTHATGNFRLAIYSDSSGPSTLQWESGSTAASATAWNTVQISAGTPSSLVLTAGTYWLAWQWDSVNSGPSYTSAASTGNYIQSAYTTYPAIWTGGTGSAEEWSIYCTYTYSYTITFTQSGVGADAVGNVLTIDGTGYTYGSLPASFTWNYLSTHTVAATPSILGAGNDYLWGSWTNGDGLSTWSGTYTVPGANTTVIANYSYADQFVVSYLISGGGSPTAPILTYVQSGTTHHYTLTTLQTAVYCDNNTAWSIAPNPLTGSGSTERWQSANTLSGTILGTQSAVFTYYHQFKETVSYTVTGGGTPTPPTYTALQYGVSTPETLTGSGVAYWIDSGSTWTITNPATGSGSTERWNTLTCSGTITTSATTVYPYYHQWLQTVSYSLPNGGSPSTPSLSGSQYGAAYTPTLTLTATDYWLDNDTAWAVTNPLSTTAVERWMSNQTYTGTVHTTQTIVFDYYHQYVQIVSYSVTGGGSPTAPDYSALQFGVSVSETLTGAPTSYWLDADYWNVLPNPLVPSSSTERWYSNQTLTGTLSMNGTSVFIYYRQYTLAVTITPTTPTSGTTIPNGTSWEDAGLNVTITAYPITGYELTHWNGTGSGNYTGSANPATVTMNGFITEQANLVMIGLNIFVFGIAVGLVLLFLVLGAFRVGGFLFPFFGGVINGLLLAAMVLNRYIVSYYDWNGFPIILDFNTPNLQYALLALVILTLTCFIVALYRWKTPLGK